MKLINPARYTEADIREINQKVRHPEAFVLQCEKDYQDQIEALVEAVTLERERYRVILLAGPSSSGKTTTAHKLSASFAKRGIGAPVVSLDDFFLGKERYPKKASGAPDMEAVGALDLPFINAALLELQQKGRSDFPRFDFTTSSRSAHVNPIVLEERDVLIVEGLHALNPRLVEVLDPQSLYRAFVSTRTKYMLDGIEVLSPKDNRLIRRIIRDHNFRNHDPIDTLLRWEDVLDGEEKYIDPFRDAAHFKIDSSHDYECCIFHHHILPMIDAFRYHGLYSRKVRQIYDILEIFDDIDYSLIPADSLLREFIGA